MSTLPEQFSAARRSQVEAQIKFFQNFTAKAAESAEKIVALNLSVTRASMEKSSAAVRQLLTAQDPRDLLALTTQTQEYFDSMMAYGRQLFSIASGTQAALLQRSAPAPAPTPAPATASTPAPAKAPALAAPVPVPEPAPEPEAVLTATVAPVEVKAKPIAKAASKVAVKPAAVKPAAAPFPAAAAPLVVSGIKPVEASPPPPQVAGKPVAESRQPDVPAPKARKKGKAK